MALSLSPPAHNHIYLTIQISTKAQKYRLHGVVILGCQNFVLHCILGLPIQNDYNYKDSDKSLVEFLELFSPTWVKISSSLSSHWNDLQGNSSLVNDVHLLEMLIF